LTNFPQTPLVGFGRKRQKRGKRTGKCRRNGAGERGAKKGWIKMENRGIREGIGRESESGTEEAEMFTLPPCTTDLGVGSVNI